MEKVFKACDNAQQQYSGGDVPVPLTGTAKVSMAPLAWVDDTPLPQKHFISGAVRSGDAEAEHWELISPAALVAIAYEEITIDNFTAKNCLEEFLETTFQFLGNSENESKIRCATLFLLFALEAGDGTVEYDGVVGYADLPRKGLQGVARACAEGAVKYSPYNWEKGMPCVEMIRHALRHVYLWLDGDREEDHLGHAAWNMFGALHSLDQWPGLNEGTMRTSGCTPPK